MKKSMIAAAVAASMVAPAAMADTTLGGQLQAELVNATGDGVVEGLYLSDGWEAKQANKGNASAFFVKGAHDLGNGLKGLYKLNFNPKFGDNFTSVGTRDAYIGLSGGFGTVLFGRLSTPYKSSTVKWDPFLATFMQARGNNGMSGLHNSYVGNVLAYANKFGPAKVVLAVALDEAKDAANNETYGNHATTASLNVPVGPVELALAYFDASEMGGGPDKNTAVKVGAKYGTGPFSVAVQYEQLDKGAGDADVIYGVGQFKAGSNTFALAYGVTQPDAAGASDKTYAALGVKHAFSKAITLHAGVTKNETDGGNDDATLIGAGLRVKF